MTDRLLRVNITSKIAGKTAHAVNQFFKNYEEGKTKGEENFSIEFFKELENCSNTN